MRPVRGAVLQAHRESADLSLAVVAAAWPGLAPEDLWVTERQSSVAVPVAMAYLAALAIAADQTGNPHYRWRCETDRWQALLAA